MNIAADDGTVLDATFKVEQPTLSIVYESAGGRTNVNARNRDYRRGLEILLGRLAAVGGVIWDIRVDSLITQQLPVDKQRVTLNRYRPPIYLAAVTDLTDLRRDMSTSARHPGARPGASKGGSSRRLRLELGFTRTWTPASLEERLANP